MHFFLVFCSLIRTINRLVKVLSLEKQRKMNFYLVFCSVIRTFAPRNV